MHYSKQGPLNTNRPTWREYQANQRRPRFKINRRYLWSACLFSAAIFYALYIAFSASASPPPPDTAARVSQAAPVSNLITKKDAQLLLNHLDLKALSTKEIELPLKEHRFLVETSLEEDLQGHLLDSMDRKNSRFIGIVVMDANSGQILALAGFNKTDPNSNPCLLSRFPAASVFKIVTAAAAVEHCGYQADTRLHFNGFKHTLYRSQLKDRINAYTNTMTFKDSFAQSVNPVFGKLGSLRLGKTLLEKYATAFGFNRPIDFELPIPPSHVYIDDEPYHWAEVASGFNNDTTLSPLHAAMMASAVLNNGRMKSPTIVERITDDTGHLIYRSQNAWYGRAMSTQAAFTLERLMETTVRSGTGRKAFRGLKRHHVLSKLLIGGKTGSIYNRAHDARFDWFVGFAKEKRGTGQLAVAVLVAHEEYIGIRAAQYARMAMTYYFNNHLAKHEKGNAVSGS